MTEAEKYAKIVTDSIRAMAEQFVAEQSKTNELIKKDQEESDKRRKERREENIWYGFATSLVSEGQVHPNDVGSYADSLLKQHLERYPA